MNISKIYAEFEYREVNEKYSHLVDIGILNENMVKDNIEWEIRGGFRISRPLLVGDLRVIRQKSQIMEIHQFPEWVIQMYQTNTNAADTLLIMPELSSKMVKDLQNMPWNTRCLKIQEILKKEKNPTYVGISYRDGVSIKVNANIPHDFICPLIGDQSVSYCQVFEPDFNSIGEVYKIDPTKIFPLEYELSL